MYIDFQSSASLLFSVPTTLNQQLNSWTQQFDDAQLLRKIACLILWNRIGWEFASHGLLHGKKAQPSFRFYHFHFRLSSKQMSNFNVFFFRINQGQPHCLKCVPVIVHNMTDKKWRKIFSWSSSVLKFEREDVSQYSIFPSIETIKQKIKREKTRRRTCLKPMKHRSS